MDILNDFTISVRKALDEIDAKWESYPGLIVAGTHTPHDVEMMIDKIRQVRERGLPFLGICAGHQYAAIEYARNVLKIKNATSEEFGPETGTFVVKKAPHLKVGGYYPDGSRWNNYEVDLPYWEKPENFFTCQSHPEYESSKKKPHSFLVSFLAYASKKQFACRWAPSLGDLDNTAEIVWGTKNYVYSEDKNRPTVFWGLYDLRDYLALWRHKGKKYVLWAGSDIRNLLAGFMLNDGKLKFLSKLLRGVSPKGYYRSALYMARLLQGAEHYVENVYEQNELAKMDIESKIVQSFLGRIGDYPLSYRYAKKPNVYISGHPGREEEYGFEMVDRLAGQVPECVFHLYGSNWQPKSENVISHGSVSREQFNKEIKDMQCGLRLNKSDGFSEITAKSVLMGQYPITFLEYPMIESFKTEKHLMKLLRELRDKKEPNYKGRNYYIKHLNRYPWATQVF